MQMQLPLAPRPRDDAGDSWMQQIFASGSASNGGVVRRRKADVVREIGIRKLELEVRRRGFHLVDGGEHLVIFCAPDPIRVIC